MKSLSLFVGTGQCNAYCDNCAGIPLRKYAPKEDGIIDNALIYRTVKECYTQGARYLSISSSGEPTLSPLAVTNVLELIHDCRNEGIRFSPINLYSNGIRIGEDKKFSDEYLPLWKKLGLTTMYITVHNIDENENAKAFGVKCYPSLSLIFSRIHDVNLRIRANLVLSKERISNVEVFSSTVKHLFELGADSISAWPIRNLEDLIDSELAPQEADLDRIGNWIERTDIGQKVRLIREEYDDKRGLKLTLFPDGTLSDSWCSYSNR